MAKQRTNGSAAGTGDGEGEPHATVIGLGDDGGDVAGDVIPTVEPATIAAEPEPGDSGQPRKRGRPRGSRNSATGTASKKQTTQDLSGILLSLHMMGAAMLKVQELEIDEAEAKRLSEAVARVNELYGGFIVSEKTAAWIQLSVALGQVYGPRALAYKLRMKHEAAQQPTVIDAQPIAVN